MAWSLRGTYFENCPCAMVCPCTTSGLTKPADAERCRVVLVFHIDSGEVHGVDVSGLTVAVLADTPQVMADGNWRVGVFMDDRTLPTSKRTSWGPSFRDSSGDLWRRSAGSSGRTLEWK